MNAMLAWDFPIFIVLALIVSVVVGTWIIRAANPSRQTPTFVCTVCGRRQDGLGARQWRYCPYCGAAKNARGTYELPRRVRPATDDSGDEA